MKIINRKPMKFQDVDKGSKFFFEGQTFIRVGNTALDLDGEPLEGLTMETEVQGFGTIKKTKPGLNEEMATEMKEALETFKTEMESKIETWATEGGQIRSQDRKSTFMADFYKRLNKVQEKFTTKPKKERAKVQPNEKVIKTIKTIGGTVPGIIKNKKKIVQETKLDLYAHDKGLDLAKEEDFLNALHGVAFGGLMRGKLKVGTTKKDALIAKFATIL